MIYFDNSATTAPSEEVLASFMEVNRKYYANPASIHRAGVQAENLLERSRDQILSLLSLEEGQVIFTSGGTEANNIALIGLARAYRNRGNHIITTAVEHPSILEACKELENEGFEVDYLQVNEEGAISPSDLEKGLRADTILVSIQHVNNEIGTIQPIQECASILQNTRTIFHSDAVQSIGKVPIDFTIDGLDAITLSAHKIHGMKGSGALVLKKGVLPEAINYGGGQEKGLRSGTVSVPNAVSLAKALRVTLEKNQSNIYKKWRERLIQWIQQYPEVEILAPMTGAPHILSIAFPYIRGEVAVNFFQENGIIVSTSSACSSKSTTAGHVVEAIHLSDRHKNGVIRISLGQNNDEYELKEFEKVFDQFIALLGRRKTNEVE